MNKFVSYTLFSVFLVSLLAMPILAVTPNDVTLVDVSPAGYGRDAACVFKVGTQTVVVMEDQTITYKEIKIKVIDVFVAHSNEENDICKVMIYPSKQNFQSDITVFSTMKVQDNTTQMPEPTTTSEENPIESSESESTQQIVPEMNSTPMQTYHPGFWEWFFGFFKNLFS